MSDSVVNSSESDAAAIAESIANKKAVVEGDEDGPVITSSDPMAESDTALADAAVETHAKRALEEDEDGDEEPVFKRQRLSCDRDNVKDFVRAPENKNLIAFVVLEDRMSFHDVWLLRKDSTPNVDRICSKIETNIKKDNYSASASACRSLFRFANSPIPDSFDFGPDDDSDSDDEELYPDGEWFTFHPYEIDGVPFTAEKIYFVNGFRY